MLCGTSQLTPKPPLPSLNSSLEATASINSNTSPAMANTPELTFHPFPKLPTEIRLKIWKIVDEERSTDVKVKVTRDEWDEPYKFKCTTQIPVLLHISHETRVEASKKYVTCFEIEGEVGRAIFINPSTDTLFIHFPNLTSAQSWRPFEDIYRTAYQRVVQRRARLPRKCAPAPWTPWGTEKFVMAMTSHSNTFGTYRTHHEQVVLVRRMEGHKDLKPGKEVVRTGHSTPSQWGEFSWQEVSRWDGLWNGVLQELGNPRR